jgi:ribosomal protein L17
MLKFVEDLLHDIRRLRHDTEQLVTSGSMKNMEQYRQMMGRLEGYTFIEQLLQDKLSKNDID